VVLVAWSEHRQVRLGLVTAGLVTLGAIFLLSRSTPPVAEVVAPVVQVGEILRSGVAVI
jgi:hypothetical protein